MRVTNLVLALKEYSLLIEIFVPLEESLEANVVILSVIKLVWPRGRGPMSYTPLVLVTGTQRTVFLPYKILLRCNGVAEYICICKRSTCVPSPPEGEGG